MRVDSSGVSLHVEITGPDSGPPVVLLHGFPDSSRLWSNQVEKMAGAGFRVIVPDQRGYGRSDKPNEIEEYHMVLLASDVVAILDGVGVERAAVVGHDWGSAIAWTVASFAPERVDRLVALSVGHPIAFATAGMAQRQKSWYLLLFHFEEIAEQWLSEDDWANFRAWSNHPDADAVIADLEANGSLTPGLNWYRANVSPRALVEATPDLPPVRVPTLGVWGSNDFALNEEQMTGSSKFVESDWQYRRIEGAGHWMQLDAPDEVNRLLLDYLG
jgi:pimeloyl-ACP methyl ester carboxylesterase